MDATNLRTVLDMLGVKRIRPSGSSCYSIPCLFPSRHTDGRDRKPSMIASIDATGPTWLKCFTCGYNGTLSRAVRTLSQQTPGGHLADIANWVEKNDGKVRGAPMYFRENRRDYTKEAKKLLGVPVPSKALRFLKEKGVHSADVVTKYLLWEPEKGLLVFPHLVRRRGRTKIIGGQCRKPRKPRKGQSKYWHLWQYDANFHLYGEHQLESWRNQTILLVEGQLDALHCWQEGVPAVANLGKSWSDAKSKLLRKSGIRKVVVFFDPDVYETTESKPTTVDDILKKIRSEGVSAIDYRGDKDPKYCSQETLLRAIETPLFKGGVHGQEKNGKQSRGHQEENVSKARSQEHAGRARHDGRGRRRRRKPGWLRS